MERARAGLRFGRQGGLGAAGPARSGRPGAALERLGPIDSSWMVAASVGHVDKAPATSSEGRRGGASTLRHVREMLETRPTRAESGVVWALRAGQMLRATMHEEPAGLIPENGTERASQPRDAAPDHWAFDRTDVLGDPIRCQRPSGVAGQSIRTFAPATRQAINQSAPTHLTRVRSSGQEPRVFFANAYAILYRQCADARPGDAPASPPVRRRPSPLLLNERLCHAPPARCLDRCGDLPDLRAEPPGELTGTARTARWPAGIMVR
jgi:hypothetical protein